MAGCKNGSSLKTYENEKYGFTLQYPSAWHAYDETNSSLVITISPGKEKNIRTEADTPVLIIEPVNHANMDNVTPDQEKTAVRDFTDHNLKQVRYFNPGAQITEDEIIINGITTIRERVKNIKLQSPFSPSNAKNFVLANETQYFLAHKGKLFRMTYDYPAKEESKYDPYFSQIALSLKFNDK